MLRGLTAWICALALAACSGSEFTSSSTGGAGGTTPSGGSGGSGGVAGGGAGGVTSGGAAGVGAAGAAGSGGAGAGGAGGMGAAGGKGGTGGLGGTGACSADLTSDPEHCGACFHSCLGAACNAGYCARTKVYSPNQPVGLALNGTDLYWGSDGANDVKRAPKDGSGVPLTLVTESSAVYYLGILGSELFWTNAAKDCKKQALSAGTPSVVEPGLGKPLGVALAGGKAYVSEYDDSKIAVLDAVNGGEKASYPLPTASGPEGIATDGTTLYVALFDAGQIVSMPVAGGTPKYFVSGQEKPAGIAVDNEAVYWTTQGSPGRLRKKSKSGGTVVELATSLVLPTGVAVDATHVYFADRGANAIYRVAK